VKAIILVGGEGTRLRPLTIHRLKGTVPMVGRPFLEYQFALLKRHGVRDITLSICHKPELVRKAFGTGSRFGVKHYATEKTPLGTAGAIKNAQKYVRGAEAVAVLNGDELTDWDFTQMARIHRKNKAMVTIGLSWVADPTAYGLVLFNSRGRVQRFVEKPNMDEVKSHWINSGLYIFDAAVFDAIPVNTNFSAERQLFQNLLNTNERVWAYTSRNYWKDIGTTAKYHQAHMDILENKMRMLPMGKTWKNNKQLRMGKNCRIHPQAMLYAPTVIGDHCAIQTDARIGDLVVMGKNVMVGQRAIIERSVLWDDISIGEGARLTGCVIASGCKIGRYTVIRPNTVLGENAVVPDYSQV